MGYTFLPAQLLKYCMSLLWVNVDLSESFSTIGITSDGSTYDNVHDVGLDSPGPGQGGSTLSGGLIPPTITWENQTFNIGPTDAPDCVAVVGPAIPLPQSGCTHLYIIATTANGSTNPLTIGVRYSDSALSDFFQGFSDWAVPQGLSGEHQVFSMPYRNRGDGGHDNNVFWLYGHIIPLDTSRIPSQLEWPAATSDPPWTYIFAINEVIDTGVTPATGSGTGTFNAHYIITGSGGGLGEGGNANETLGTFDNFHVTTEDGKGIILREGSGIAPALTHNVTGSGEGIGSGSGSVTVSYNVTGVGGSNGSGAGHLVLTHHITGVGGSTGSGTGVVDEHTGSGQHYIIVGTGGSRSGGTGFLKYTEGATTRLQASCVSERKKLFVLCRGAYVPVITRCIQYLGDPDITRICRIDSR